MSIKPIKYILKNKDKLTYQECAVIWWIISVKLREFNKKCIREYDI